MYPKTSPFFTASVPKTASHLPHRTHSLDVLCGARHLSPSFHSKLGEDSSFPSYKGRSLTHSHALPASSQMAQHWWRYRTVRFKSPSSPPKAGHLAVMLLVAVRTLLPSSPLQVIYREFCQKQSGAVGTLLVSAVTQKHGRVPVNAPITPSHVTQQSL